MVKETIEHAAATTGSPNTSPAFGEAVVRGQDHGALLLAGVDELEDSVGAVSGDQQVTDLSCLVERTDW